MPQLSLQLVPPLRPAVAGTSAPQGREAPPVQHPVEAQASPRAAAIAHLRALVGSRGRVGALPRAQDPAASLVAVAPGNVSTGIAGMDAWLRGWCRPGPVEIAGAPGGGRLALLLPLLERLTRQGHTAILVDPLHQVFPPGLGRIDPARLVLVRPPGERAGWAAEQVARSGAAEVLVVLDAPPFGRGGVRLARAAEAGGMLVFVLAERAEAELPASLRLEVGGWQGDHVRVQCTRSRDGRMLGERLVTPYEAPPDGPSDVTPVPIRPGAPLRVGRA